MRRLCCLVLALALAFAFRAQVPLQSAEHQAALAVHVAPGQPGTGGSAPSQPDLAPPAIVASGPSWTVSQGDALCAVQPLALASPASIHTSGRSGRACHTVPPQSRRFPLLI